MESLSHTCGNAGGFPGGNPLQVPGAAELPGRCPALSVSDCARSGSAAAMFSAVTKSMLDCVLAARAAAALTAALPIAGIAARAWAGRTCASAKAQDRLQEWTPAVKLVKQSPYIMACHVTCTPSIHNSNAYQFSSDTPKYHIILTWDVSSRWLFCKKPSS